MTEACTGCCGGTEIFLVVQEMEAGCRSPPPGFDPDFATFGFVALNKLLDLFLYFIFSSAKRG